MRQKKKTEGKENEYRRGSFTNELEAKKVDGNSKKDGRNEGGEL